MICWVAALFCGMSPQPEDPARFGAGTPPVERNLRYVRLAPIDGDGRAETRADKACLRTDTASGNGYLYFDVRYPWLKAQGAAPFRAELAIEYLDDGTGTVAVQYDATGNDIASNFREVSWRRTGSGQWRTQTLTLEEAEFRNAQHGQADFRIAAGSGGDVCIAGISLRILSASARTAPRPTLPEPVLPGANEIRLSLGHVAVVPLSPLNEAERIALAQLKERLRVIGSSYRSAPRPAAVPSPSGSQTISLVVGRWRPALARRFPNAARLIRRLVADPKAFRRRDGYVICLERAGKRPVVCAVALESPGAVYALGDIVSRALRDDGAPTLRVASVPQVEAPALDRRELYLNIGYGLRRPGITVEDWSLPRWKRYIDALVLARYNAWSFYLWGDGETLHPASANQELNRRLHNTLRQAIAYSHRRGLKVGMQFTPTMLPAKIWQAHPELRAKLEYSYPGTVCPSQPEALRLMREVHRSEIRYFSDVDFYSLWFYDVGGCFCDTCRVPEQQLHTVLEQVKTFAEIGRQANPRAAFQVMTWGIWRYERMHHYSIRDRFVTEAKRWFADRQPLQMADGISVDPGAAPLFDLMRREKIPANVFLYQTNIETGQPLPILLTRYLSKWVPEAIRAGATSAFLMRMEAGTKTADDAVAGAYLWNPSSGSDAVLLHAARLLTGDAQAARYAWEALRRMDDFAWFGRAGGGADAARGRRIAELSRRAVAGAPPGLRSDLEWLRTGGEAYRILGAAVEARDDENDAGIQTQNAAFSDLMRRSPLFHNQADGAPYWRNLFRDSLVRFFYTGWAASQF